MNAAHPEGRRRSCTVYRRVGMSIHPLLRSRFRGRRLSAPLGRGSALYTKSFRGSQMNNETTRRDWIMAGAASSLLILKPHLVRAAQANSALSVGLIGCGRRGTAISKLFVKNEF